MIGESDLVIDAIGAFFYLGVVLHAVYALSESRGKGMTSVRIMLLFFVVVALLYIFQTIMQFVTGEFGNRHIWDILNFIQAVASMMAVILVGKMTGISLSSKCPNNKLSKFP